jgi:hypothetical protein
MDAVYMGITSTQDHPMNDNNYWNHNGKHQSLSETLVTAMIPTGGKAETSHGELLRCLLHVHYDFYNNGGYNLAHSRADKVTHLIENAPADTLSSEAMEAIKSLSGAKDFADAVWDDDLDDSMAEDEYEFLAHHEPFLANFERLMDDIIVYVAGKQGVSVPNGDQA